MGFRAENSRRSDQISLSAVGSVSSACRSLELGKVWLTTPRLVSVEQCSANVIFIHMINVHFKIYYLFITIKLYRDLCNFIVINKSICMFYRRYTTDDTFDEKYLLPICGLLLLLIDKIS